MWIPLATALPVRRRLARAVFALALLTPLLAAVTCTETPPGPPITVDDGTEVDDTTWNPEGFGFRNRIGRRAGESHDLGLAFETPDLDPGQQIAFARLVIPATGDGSVSSPLPLEIQGLDVDEVAPFAQARPSQVPTVPGSVAWTIPHNWPGFVAGETWTCIPLRRYSPDVAPLVNAILARPGWGSGATRNLGFVVKDANTPGAADNFVTAQDAEGFGSCDHSARLEIYPTVRDTFLGKELLGRATDESVTVHAWSLLPVDVYYEFGVTPGSYTGATASLSHAPETPIVTRIDGLAADTRYWYRMRYRRTGEPVFEAGPERTFHTQRAPESSFRFVVQADSHLQWRILNYDLDALELYQRALDNMAADQPDFMVDLGDTFQSEFLTIGRSVADLDEAVHRHLDQRPWFERVAHSAPLYLAIGNHEGEVGWDLDGTPDNVPVWATLARKLTYPNPEPDGFYTGDPLPYPFVGARQSVYAWEWGDALLVTLDPYWHTLKKPHDVGGPATGDRWDWTLGDTQYFWLNFVLSTSSARWKLIFAHQVVGGVTDYGRGGVNAASHALGGVGSYEWGGENSDGSWGFGDERAIWPLPVHDLMVANDVDVFFHGHDHVYVREELDHVVYQEVPQPSNAAYSKGFPENVGIYANPLVANSGHLRVDVSPVKLTVSYVRAYLDGDGQNGEVETSWSISDCNRNGVVDGKEALVCECADGLDNDLDGLIDFPDDPGCGLDNDPIEDGPAAGCGLGFELVLLAPVLASLGRRRSRARLAARPRI